MISAKALCSAFRQAYDEHWGYIWGEAGDVWTRAAQDAATRVYYKMASLLIG